MKKSNSPQNGDQQAKIDLQQQLIQESTIHRNIKQKFITTTEDKIKLILLEYLKKITDKKSWIAPLGFLVTLGLVPITTNFKDTPWISAQVLQAMCYWAIIFALIWFIYSMCLTFSTKNMTIDDIIEKLKKSDENGESTKVAEKK